MSNDEDASPFRDHGNGGHPVTVDLPCGCIERGGIGGRIAFCSFHRVLPDEVGPGVYRRPGRK